jgi:hypothetical protein
MREISIRQLLIAMTTLLLIAGTTAAQEIGLIVDPDPNIEGYFEHTADDWKFKGPSENEVVHELAVIYGQGMNEDLVAHLELETGLGTQTN